MSKKIYVADDYGQPQLIESGIEKYSELTDAPIKTTYNGILTVNSFVTVENSKLILTPNTEGIHGWTEAEILLFCQNAEAGRYDIYSAEQGQEILMIDTSNVELGRRYRRINVDYDTVWDSDTEQWITISDTSAKQLIYKFINESEIPGSVVVGDPFIIKLYYYSNVGTGRITVTMNDVAFTAGTVKSGETINLDLTSRIVDGANTISVKIANDATQAFVPELNITGINLNYTPNFDQYQPFTSSIVFNYSCSGSSNKVIHFDITNAEGIKNSYEINHGSGYYGATATLNAAMFSKGENTIETYMYAIDSAGYEITRTITTTYKVPFLTDDEPLLMVYYDEWEGLKQYSTISIPYYVWRRTSGNLDSIHFMISSAALGTGYIMYEYGASDAGAIVNYLMYNAKHEWLISSLPTTFIGTEDKKALFSMNGTYDDTNTNIFEKSGVSIESSSSAMQTIEGYKFNFAANDLQRRAYDAWNSTGTEVKTMNLEGFNWNTDGVQTDADGNQSLHFSPAASATLSETTNPLFDKYNVPFALEIDFKVSESAIESPIIKYYDTTTVNPDLYGLFIYPNKAVFKYTGGSSEINYIKGERTHLVYTICNKSVADIDPATGQTKTANLLYLFVYLNGILSQMKTISSATSFPKQCGTIKFNCNNNEFDLYSFRGYSFSLTSAQVLQNYISDFGRASTKETTYLKNNIYSDTEETGVQGEFKVSFDKVKGKIPCYVVVSDSQPDTKSYVDCRGIYYEAEGDEQLTQWKNGHSMATTYYYTRASVNDPWIRSKKIKYCGQGTSSLAYPRKNFKFKHNDKFYIKGHKDGKEKNFTMKADWLHNSPL